MLPINLFSKNISKIQIKLPYQWVNITFNVIRFNSSEKSDSSSSDSDSDSDSDKSTNKKFKGIDYLGATKEIHKKKQIEKQLTKAAQLLTTTSGKDKEKVIAQLLDNISFIQNESSDKSNEGKGKKDIQGGKQKDKENLFVEQDRWQKKNANDNFFMKYDVSKEPSIIRMLRNQQEKSSDNNEKFEKKGPTEREPSIIRMLRNQQARSSGTNEKLEKKDLVEREPSVSRMLREQQARSSDTIEELEKKNPVEKEPSVSRMLREQQKKLKIIDNKFVKKDQAEEELSAIKMLQQKQSSHFDKKFEQKTQTEEEPSVSRMLQKQRRGKRSRERMSLDMKESMNEVEPKLREPSVFNALKTRERRRTTDILHKKYDEDWHDDAAKKSSKDNLKFEKIFINEYLETPDALKFKIWDICEEKELQSLVTRYPENAFQEMINWTKEGKLWKFPIDNEQGMEAEQNVHFSEHVFLERHLTPWCPPKGPIRHFMELVCVGLSKNPYLTIEEKYDHIMWYKDYFKDKQDLLNKLGLVE